MIFLIVTMALSVQALLVTYTPTRLDLNWTWENANNWSPSPPLPSDDVVISPAQDCLLGGGGVASWVVIRNRVDVKSVVVLAGLPECAAQLRLTGPLAHLVVEGTIVVEARGKIFLDGSTVSCASLSLNASGATLAGSGTVNALLFVALESDSVLVPGLQETVLFTVINSQKVFNRPQFKVHLLHLY